MLADPPMTRDDRMLLASLARRAEPKTRLVDLFPHLVRVSDRPVGGRHGTSKRLATILAAWHGPTWGPYVQETIMAVRMRRNLGHRTLGEFLGAAIAAADPDNEVESTAPTDTASSSVAGSGLATDLAPVRAGRALIAELAHYDAVPPFPVRHVSGRSMLETARDVPFQGLVPDLGCIADEWIDADVAMPRRLRGLLSRWHGLRWGRYLLETPGSLYLRRNGGVASVGLFLWMAARHSGCRSTAPVRAAGDSASIPSQTRSSDHDIDDAVSRLTLVLERSNARQRMVIRRRLVGPGRGDAVTDLAREFGCSKGRVQQLWGDVYRRLRGEVATVDPLRRTVQDTRDALGLGWPLAALDRVPPFRGPILGDLDQLETALLLFAAGPYEPVGDWLVLRPAGQRLHAARRALREATASGPITLAAAQEVLAGLGWREPIIDDLITTFFHHHVEQGMVGGSSRQLHAYCVWRAGRSRRRRAPDGSWTLSAQSAQFARQPGEH
jgi:hypothetical protein